MKDKLIIKRILSLTFAFILAAGYVFPSVQYDAFALEENSSADAAAYKADWSDSIPDMLAAGKYEEGVVVAGIDMTKARKSGDPGSALDSRTLRSGAEEIISIEGDETDSQQGFFSWFRQLKDSLSGQSDDSLCIISIRRDGMTTEQILRLLAADDSVVFAEPNYIIDMPVTLVKLDKHLSEEYFKNNKAQAIVNTVIEMAHSIGIKIIAEGIETESQLEAMKSLGVDYIQGYFFSKPLPEHEYLKFIQTNNLR